MRRLGAFFFLFKCFELHHLFYLFIFLWWGRGGVRNIHIWGGGGGHEDFVDIFLRGGGGGGLRQNSTSLRGLFYVFFGSFLKVDVQNENILAWQKFQIFFGVLDIPDIIWRQTVDAGPNPTYEEKRESIPPTHTPPGSQSMMRRC